ncbi:MAG: glycoside hydrolase family 9 protein [Oscillospiraceae bacterium]|nr:glycoside hydrolase family 9 protein [Oscillospiraceae bacterium]
MKKRLTSLVLAASLLTASLPAATVETGAAGNPDYASALQMSLFFYECQQAGHLPEWNRVEWKADSNTVDEIDGGWYDAGDHVKFNLPMAYSASMLAWGLYQYPDGVEQSGEMTNYVNNLEYVMDYFVRCDKGTSVVYQVGNGTKDHTWWGPAELYEYGMGDAGTSLEECRATLEASEGCSCVFGGMAAALAAGYCALDGRVDDSKREGYLKSAKNIFKLADASKSDDVYNDSDASGFYRSSHFYDELFYAANWLYKATGDKDYLDKATSYIGHLDKELGQDCLKYTWCHCWDDTMQGAMLLYAQNTNDQTYIDHVKKHIDYLVNTCARVENDKNGLLYVHNWGCARYAETAGFLTAVANDTVLKGQNTEAYQKFYKQQIDYVLGDNPTGHSYVVGYGENAPRNAHHRTAAGSWKNDIYTPVLNRHILYGALVGGPTQDGEYVDDRNNYINNEVATDYNAGFTALLYKMLDEYGGKSDPSFPPKEEHDAPEFYVEALNKGISAQGATVSFKITNHSAWPARVQDNISFKYFMDLSEAKAMGLDPTQVVVRCDRDQSAMYSGKGIKSAEISEIKHYDGDIYYVEVNLPDGRAVLPVSEGMQQCEILLAFVLPDYKDGWDGSNDFSNKDILTAKGTEDATGKVTGVVTKYVPVYVNGELYYGIEPDGTEAFGDASANAKPDPEQPSTEKPTEKPTEPKDDPTEPLAPPPTDPDPSDEPTNPNEDPTDNDKIVYGDVDLSGKVDILDVITLNKNLMVGEAITNAGKRNADVDNNGSVDEVDSLNILKYVVEILVSFPV